ncbi:hypothetical protein F6Y05_40610 [Bacillus megaterium]|nr:hypothetical protein [Priestia megaterium]
MNGKFLFSVPASKFKEKPVKQNSEIFFAPISHEIEQAVPYLENHWKMQDNRNDRLTDSVVYNAQTFSEVEKCYERNPKGSLPTWPIDGITNEPAV